ncbi:MAG: ATP-binding cassette domain-containing protein [Actinomycetia bacterium]|nr:ATP-binding cassette domain-containing protein [Actinomycetes bacterium]
MSEAIRVLGLRKSFKTQTVLDDVCFTVADGEVFALLGSNGAGKTTLIKILTTLLRADGGSAAVCGYDVAKQGRRVRESISLTGQSTAVDDILSGRENLIMMAKLRHLSDPKSEAERQLAQFGLTDAANKPLSAYSGGMRRRLDLAMSMIGSPQVVFLDEPTTGLDPQGRLAVWETIRAMGKSGVTVFLTTQYLEEADSLADRIAILHNGSIVAQGLAAELKRLAPPPKLVFSFLEEGDMAQASGVLAAYDVKSEALTLTVTTDGSVGQTTEILSQLEGAGIVATFAQKPPTLEEAFLTIIREGQHEPQVCVK